MFSQGYTSEVCDLLRTWYNDLNHKSTVCVSIPASFEALGTPAVPAIPLSPALACVEMASPSPSRSAWDMAEDPGVLRGATILGKEWPALSGKSPKGGRPAGSSGDPLPAAVGVGKTAANQGLAKTIPKARGSVGAADVGPPPAQKPSPPGVKQNLGAPPPLRQPATGASPQRAQVVGPGLPPPLKMPLPSPQRPDIGPPVKQPSSGRAFRACGASTAPPPEKRPSATPAEAGGGGREAPHPWRMPRPPVKSDPKPKTGPSEGTPLRVAEAAAEGRPLKRPKTPPRPKEEPEARAASPSPTPPRLPPPSGPPPPVEPRRRRRRYYSSS